MTNTRKLNNKRQKIWMSKNRDLFNQKRREKYAIKKSNVGNAEIQQNDVIPVEPEYFEIEVSKKIKKNKRTNEPILTYEEAVIKLNELDRAPASISTYASTLKRFIEITGCKDVNQCLKNHKKIIKEVNEGTDANGNLYAINTRKLMFQSILFWIDTFKLNIDKAPYKAQLQLYKEKSTDENNEKKKNETVLRFSDYLELVKKNFGENSKMFLISSMYFHLTVRDNFRLKIITKLNENTDDKTNYLFVPPRANCQILINSFKTDKNYEKVKYICPNDLNKLIRDYINQNEVKDYLFSEKTLTNFVSTRNKMMGLKGSISLFRKMKVSTELEDYPNKTAEERIELSNKMLHSPVTQSWYLRQLKII